MTYTPETVFDLEPESTKDRDLQRVLRSATLFVLDRQAYDYLWELSDCFGDENSELWSMVRFAKSPYPVTAIAFPDFLGVIVAENGDFRTVAPVTERPGNFTYLDLAANLYSQTLPDEDMEIFKSMMDYEKEAFLDGVVLSYAFFLTLHQEGAYSFTPQKRFARITRKGKRKVYLARTRVKLDLAKIREPRMSDFSGSRGPVRRHQYRGHWTHWLMSRSCVHRWLECVNSTIEQPRYRCEICGGKRTWRKSGWRGDATVGLVTKDYDVTHSEYPT